MPENTTGNPALGEAPGPEQATRVIEPEAGDGEHTKLVGPARRASASEAASSGLPVDGGELDPVVGWLVVLAGPGRGNARRLGYGQNSLGRDKGERVSLDFGDGSISCDRAASPVVGVSAYDALAFCRWLTSKERNDGIIDPQSAYRLPTLAEWDAALGKHTYPWGDQWPPRVGAGNYGGKESAKLLGSANILDGYDDGFAGTSPVGTYQGNPFGFYDLGGNAMEWTSTWYRKEMNPAELRARFKNFDNDGDGQAFLVTRGSGWYVAQQAFLNTSHHDFALPALRAVSLGFRCVLAPAAEHEALILPSLSTSAERAELPAGAMDKRLVGIWETKVPNPIGGTFTFRWEQETDGHWELSGGTFPDAGTLAASDGRMQQHSEKTNIDFEGTYRFRSTTSLVTRNPLGEASWRRISSTTTKQKSAAQAKNEAGEVEDHGSASTKEKSGGSSNTGSKKSSGSSSRSRGSNVERKATDAVQSIRRRFGF